MKNSFKLDLPISGGWWYGIEDCVIIDKTDPTVNPKLPFKGTEIEYAFIEKRIYAELIVFQHRDNQFSGINWDLTTQMVQEIEDRKFDVLNFRVSALPDRDWELLKADWERNNSYVNDEKEKELHLKERDQRTCFYDTQYCVRHHQFSWSTGNLR